MRYGLLTLAIVALAACEPRVRTEVIDVPCMGVGYIYEWDTVQHYLGSVSDNVLRLSASYQEKGEKLEETNPQGALMAYKRAIALSPDAEGYLNLVRYLEKTENDLELMRVLEFLVEEVEPESLIGPLIKEKRKELILSLLISYLNNNVKTFDEWFLNYEEQGWPRAELVEALAKDERIRADKESPEFQTVLFNLGDEAYCEKMLNSGRIAEYMLNSVERISDSLAIGEAELASFEYNAEEEDIFLELHDNKSMFFRALPYTYKHRFRFNLYSKVLLDSPDEIGLVYALDSSLIGRKPEERNVAFFFTLVNKENHAMSKPVCIAWQTADTLVTCSLRGYVLNQKKYAKVWENGFKPESQTNRLIRKDLISEQRQFLHGGYREKKHID